MAPLVDTHTLYCATEDLDSNAVEKAFRDAIRKLEQQGVRIPDKRVHTNVIHRCGEDGTVTRIGLTYVFVSTELYHAVLGRNTDGSLRERKIEKKAQPDLSLPMASSWADEEIEDVKVVALPPLITMPFEVKGARIMEEDPDYYDLRTIFLKVTNDKRVTLPQLKEYFARFSWDGQVPHIHLSSHGRCSALISFYSPQQAQMTLLMCKKTKIGDATVCCCLKRRG